MPFIKKYAAVMIRDGNTITVQQYDLYHQAKAAYRAAADAGKTAFLYGHPRKRMFTSGLSTPMSTTFTQTDSTPQAGTVLNFYGEQATRYDADGNMFTGQMVLVEVVANGDGSTTLRRTDNAGGFYYPNGFVISNFQTQYLEFNWQENIYSGTFQYETTFTKTIANGNGTTRTQDTVTRQPTGYTIYSWEDDMNINRIRYNGEVSWYLQSEPKDNTGGDQYGLSNPVYHSSPCGDMQKGTFFYDLVNGEQVNTYTSWEYPGTQIGLCEGLRYISDGEGGVYTEEDTVNPPPDDTVCYYDSELGTPSGDDISPVIEENLADTFVYFDDPNSPAGYWNGNEWVYYS